jgi:itaconyl-CoA hydratase
MAIKEGWKGRFYEDFEIGDIYVHPLGRTILAADNTWFSLLTMNTNPLHFDYHYSSKTEFGKPLVDSCLTLAILTQEGFSNLGWDEVVMPHPVFDGDTIYSKSEVLEKRESDTHSDRGIVRVKTTGVNQNGVTVMQFKRTFMAYKRNAAAFY